MQGTQLDAFGHWVPGASVPEPLSAQAVLAQLAQWSEDGRLRRLDSAFADFLLEWSPGLSPVVVLVSAWVAHLEGQGHTCLMVPELLGDEIPRALAWPELAQAQWQTLLAGLPPQLPAWLSQLRQSPVVHCVGAEVDRHQPLILSGDRLYLRRYWNFEQRVAAQVRRRVEAVRAVESARVRGWLDQLFDRSPSLDWQKLACAVALRAGLSLITGGPGTGKTYTAARLLALLHATHEGPEPLRVGLAAPTGKAAARLKQSIDTALGQLQSRWGDDLPLRDWAQRMGPARTVHAWLGARPDTRRWQHDASHPLELDVLIVDEASMIHLEMMAGLLEALQPQARIILLGDKDQLASVEAGAVLGELCREAQAGHYTQATERYAMATTGHALPEALRDDAGSALAQQTVMLRSSYRFAGPIGQLALAVNAGDAPAATNLLRQAPGGAVSWIEAHGVADVVRLAVHGRPGAPGGYRNYLTLLKERPAMGDPQAHASWVHQVLSAFDGFRILCALRGGDAGVISLNLAIEQSLSEQAGLPSAPGPWYEGRPVMVTRNDAALGVFNGDIGMTLRPPTAGAGLRVYFSQGAALHCVSVSRLASVETAFAMTVHKAQGSEFEHTALVLPLDAATLLTRELVYTGITRASRAFTLLAPHLEVLEAALARSMRRSSGLACALSERGPLQEGDSAGVKSK